MGDLGIDGMISKVALNKYGVRIWTGFSRLKTGFSNNVFWSQGSPVTCLATNWTTGRSRFDPRQRRKDFSSSLCVQTGSGAHPATCPVGTQGPFPGAWPGVTLTTPLRSRSGGVVVKDHVVYTSARELYLTWYFQDPKIKCKGQQN
jgi:hypothetical protein